MRHTISNQALRATIDEHGAELTSLVSRNDATEYIWQADPQYWQGQSPILFPTVGNSYGQQIRHNGVAYPMPKHGLVKDMDFTLTEQTADSLTLSVESNETTLAHYPFRFRLSVCYRLVGRSLNISFAIANQTPSAMPFMLGAHPAFNLPRFSETDAVHGYLSFGNVREKLVSLGLKPGGFAWAEGAFDVGLNADGLLPLTNETFLCDTILDATSRVRTCALYNKERQPVVSLHFTSPVLALWAPQGGRAPFVCIEPWWGLCDADGYQGEMGERPFANRVPAGETASIAYRIDIL